MFGSLSGLSGKEFGADDYCLVSDKEANTWPVPRFG